MVEDAKILYDREKGEALILRAERINKQDIIGALREDDFNMVIRRAQESVELTLKVLLRYRVLCIQKFMM